MAKGFNEVSTVVDAGESRPIAPIGAPLEQASGGQPERLYVYYINAQVLVSAPGSATLSDNAGNVLLMMDTSVPFNTVNKIYQSDSPRLFSGRPLPAGSPLLATVTGGQVAFECSYEVR